MVSVHKFHKTTPVAGDFAGKKMLQPDAMVQHFIQGGQD